MKHEELIALLREARQVLNGDVECPLTIVDRIDAALSEPVDLVALSDVADLQRYTLGGHCDSFGQDCGAEMEQDDEGEYLLFIDVLSLGPKSS